MQGHVPQLPLVFTIEIISSDFKWTHSLSSYQSDLSEAAVQYYSDNYF